MAIDLQRITAMENEIRLLLDDPNLDLEHPLVRDMQALLHELRDFRAQAGARAAHYANQCDLLVALIETDIRTGAVTEGNIDAQLLLAQTRDAATELRGSFRRFLRPTGDLSIMSGRIPLTFPMCRCDRISCLFPKRTT